MIERKILLNPGPVTTTDSVKASQVVPDICPREKEFGNLCMSISKDLIKISGGEDQNHACVLFGGSGTAGMESVISSVIPANETVLIINNGAYGKRFIDIAKTYNLSYEELAFAWDEEINIKRIEEELEKNDKIKYIAVVHHETTTGLLNPVKDIGEIAKKYECTFIVDAISSFSGIPFSVKDCNIDFMISTSNKCIQGMPGVCFIICNKEKLEKIKDNPKRSFYLDLYSQYEYFKKNCQSRFTPPVQTLYALRKAIDELLKEGAENRYRRYIENNKLMVAGMESLGFKKIFKNFKESGLLTTFLEPENINYSFDKMHDLLYKKGFTIYPGKIKEKTFRIANIGEIYPQDIKKFLISMERVLKEMNIKLYK